MNVHSLGYGAQVICSYVLWPLAVLIGVDIPDCRKVAELIGVKTFLTEFIAYAQLSGLIQNREALESHVAMNGTWYWSGDDVILINPGREYTTLVNGVITVHSSAYVSAVCFLARVVLLRLCYRISVRLYV